MYPKVTFALPFPNVAKLSSLYKLNQSHHLDCEQALWGPLAVGQEKEGRLATMSLEFEYLHWKSQCECWLAEMTFVMTSLSLACVFQCCLHSRSFLLRTDWQKYESSVNREPQVNWRWNSNPRDIVGYGWLQALLPFPTPPPEHPGELAHRLVTIWLGVSLGRSSTLIVICKCTQYL